MNQYPEERGILKSAYEHQVPVFVPAFHDSELGNDVYLDNHVRKNQGRQPILFNLELDTEFLLNMMTNSPKIGIFTIGGGAKEKLSAFKSDRRIIMFDDWQLKDNAYSGIANLMYLSRMQ